MTALRTDGPHGRVGLALVVLALGIAVGGCRRSTPAGAETTSGALTAEAVAEATQIFQQRCVACHGAQGKGDGPASAALAPKPRDFSSAEWQKSVTDEALEKIIVYGGAAVGKSAAMPGNPDLDSKPAVVKALRQHVRNLAGEVTGERR